MQFHTDPPLIHVKLAKPAFKKKIEIYRKIPKNTVLYQSYRIIPTWLKKTGIFKTLPLTEQAIW
jgi:hypothetical protein